MAQVLLYELLFGKGIQCGGRYRLAINKHKSALTSALARIKVKMGVVDNRDLLPDVVKNEVILPRYVRVNTLKSTVHDVIQNFLEEGYHCILTREQASTKRQEGQSANDICEMQADFVKTLKPRQFMCDVHLEDLLVFPPATDFHDHHLYRSGAIILQDKASCLPASVLAPPPESHVIDACAAPGNKTSHLAAILENTGKVFAFDVDPKRVSTLSAMTAVSGATNLEIAIQDFLKVNPREERFSNVRYILVDPSCSGSGIVSRLDHLTNDGQSNSTERLEALAAVQVKLLSHALSFPHVKRVAYSTCSVHRAENEGVVAEALAANTDFELDHLLPTWKNRGIKVADDSASRETSPEIGGLDVSACLRAVPKEDLTNGFFVAVLQRKGQSTQREQAREDSKPVRNSTCRSRKNRSGQIQTTTNCQLPNKTLTSQELGNQVDHVDDATKCNSRKRRKRKRIRAKTEEPHTTCKKLTAEDSVHDYSVHVGPKIDENHKKQTKRKKKRRKMSRIEKSE
ncbi:probable 28S rRNA (cytosine-C(5))-methyltransferase isoform X2 [Acanthaster planci]|nr:probable 28S rRNA (cytosine-C(5))-methyltransferase isoform X2 [Acanthaster planci]